MRNTWPVDDVPIDALPLTATAKQSADKPMAISKIDAKSALATVQVCHIGVKSSKQTDHPVNNFPGASLGTMTLRAEGTARIVTGVRVKGSPSICTGKGRADLTTIRLH